MNLKGQKTARVKIDYDHYTELLAMAEELEILKENEGRHSRENLVTMIDSLINLSSENTRIALKDLRSAFIEEVAVDITYSVEADRFTFTKVKER